MEYIDKTVLENEGEAIIKSFLKRLKTEGANYPQDLYEAFKSDRDDAGISSKDKLIDVILKEQSEHCCYCMKRLTQKEEVTLEHLILNSVTRHKEFADYFKRETILGKKVCLASDFIHNEETKFPPYPHTIAYQNLTASCDGRIMPGSRTVYCCNLKRESKHIEPIVLYDTIKEEVSYRLNGRAAWNKEQELIPTLNKLGLNDAVLRMIRRIWIYCKKKEINLSSVEKKTLLYDMLSEFSDEDFKDTHEFAMLLNFQKEVYWGLLEEYCYFGE